jgi:predicted phage terminase large subunit-like protein
MQPETRLSAGFLSALPDAEREAFFDALSEEDAQFLLRDWQFWARDEQLPPARDWRIWLFMGGRGSGKTRAGAEWIAEGIAEGRMKRVALIAATHMEARSVMIEGESGLLAASKTAVYEPSNRRVLWPGGAVATVLSADEPDSIRGHQFDAAWADEFCKWRDPQAGLDMILMALRLGQDPKILITTTPRNIGPLHKLVEMKDVALATSTTRDNAGNLAPGFIEMLEARYAGTRLGRQELDGDLIEDNEAALWRRDWIEASRVRDVPELEQIVVAIDPAAGTGGDECGIVVAGRSYDGEAYVLADRSAGGLTPVEWAARAIAAFGEFKADLLVAEANQGGEMVSTVLRQQLRQAPVKLVYASRDKHTRALPFAALYERGLVHHAACFGELEDQLCQFDGSGPSPDRLDALVWALAELMPAVKVEPKVRTI